MREAAEAAVQAAKGRVEQAKEHFQLRPKKDREKAIEESRTKHPYDYRRLFRLLADHEWEVECPACSGRAFLAGMSYGEEVSQGGVGEWEEEVEKSYGAEELRCPVCDLHLDSRAEIEAAAVNPDLTVVETREREYEPDYGND